MSNGVKPWWRSQLVWTGIIALTLLGVLFWWLHDERDVRRAEAALRDLGIEPTYAGVGISAVPSADAARLHRVHALAAALRSYQETAGWEWKSGLPIPDQMRAHHAAMPQAMFAQLCAELRTWTTKPVQICDPTTLRQQGYDALKPVHALLQERAAIMQPGEAEEVQDAWVGVIAGTRATTVVELLVGCSAAARLRRAVMAHENHSLRLSWVPVLERLVPIMDDWRNQMDDAMAREAWMRLDPANGTMRNELATCYECMLGIPTWAEGFGVGVIGTRLVRPELLSRLVEAMGTWQSGMPFHVRYQAYPQHRCMFDPNDPLTWNHDFPGNIECAYQMLDKAFTMAPCEMRVLVALLRHEPWPIDPTSSSGAPVRPILRDGDVIGGYACGVDGVDDGGSRQKDACFSFGALLGSPMAADPVVDPTKP